uniref:Uncharacterized protein n=1 Tax=Rhodopseudomonas palustris (strain BisA53) TaxID=316055 RepID=Q07HV6_RHOP5
MVSSLPEHSVRILDHVRDHGRVSIGEIARLTGVGRNTLKEHFRLLRSSPAPLPECRAPQGSRAISPLSSRSRSRQGASHAGAGDRATEPGPEPHCHLRALFTCSRRGGRTRAWPRHRAAKCTPYRLAERRAAAIRLASALLQIETRLRATAAEAPLARQQIVPHIINDLADGVSASYRRVQAFVKSVRFVKGAFNRFE